MNLLVVEDDERVRRFVRRGLQAEGHTVTLARDGPDGFERARHEDYDVVILDVMLPGIDGNQVCSRLRSERRAMPIMMLTALDQTDQKVSALRGGADDYLTKPFDFDELLARIEALGRRSKKLARQDSEIIQLGSLSIDKASMTVHYEGRDIELTAKEFGLLELFAESRGRVLSRTRILNKIWGYDSDPLTNIVDVYVRRLRGKMDWGPQTGWIRTVRSYGYKMQPMLD
ncbi:response regulator transcription factor [Alteraurantiacibacter aquimixticola]|uniref:Response regulator transcription factor n=2 Tax=Alteraurantiacibacter aquimixticola TaxID=2489173 RepID=A0A4T3F8R6_9SPHN|nr:response regulator transcription factor [Alteraurantiacibacter aquimixticola]